MFYAVLRHFCKNDNNTNKIFGIIESNNIAQEMLEAEDLSFDWHSKAVLRLMGHRAVSKAFKAMKIPFRLRW